MLSIDITNDWRTYIKAVQPMMDNIQDEDGKPDNSWLSEGLFIVMHNTHTTSNWGGVGATTNVVDYSH